MIDNREYLAYTLLPPSSGRSRRARVPAVPRRRARRASATRPRLLAVRPALGRERNRPLRRQDDRGAERARRRVLAERRDRVPAHGRGAPRRRARRPLPALVQRARRAPSRVVQPAGAPPVATTRLVDYGGSLEQAMRDLMAWVEDGTDPPKESGYVLDDDQRLTLAAARGRPRRGAAGGARRGRRCGPRRCHRGIVGDAHRRRRGAARRGHDHRRRVGLRRHRHVTRSRTTASTAHERAVRLETTHHFDRAGTYFPCVRVTAHRDGDVTAAHCRLVNLGRVRVVVS